MAKKLLDVFQDDLIVSRLKKAHEKQDRLAQAHVTVQLLDSMLRDANKDESRRINEIKSKFLKLMNNFYSVFLV